MQLILGMILCNIPGVLLLIYTCRQAGKEAIPAKIPAILIVVGILLMIPVVALQTAVGALGNLQFLKSHPFFSEIIMTAVRLAFVEELCKFLGTMAVTWKGKYFTKPRQAVLIPAILSLAFGIIENVMFMMLSFTSLQSQFWIIVLTRAFIGAPGHGAYGIIMGRSYWKAKEESLRGNAGEAFRFCCLAVLIPGCIHGLYDWLASSQFVRIGNTNIVTAIMVVLDLIVIVLTYRFLFKSGKAEKVR